MIPFFPQFSCSFSVLKSFLIGLLDLLVHKLLESGLYIRGSTAIVIHFQIMTNFDPFQYQIFIQLGIHTTFYAKSFCFFVFFFLLNLCQYNDFLIVFEHHWDFSP